MVWTARGAALAVAGACSGAEPAPERSVARSGEAAASASPEPNTESTAASPPASASGAGSAPPARATSPEASSPSGSDTHGQLGRCDASVRAAGAELLRALTRAEPLRDAACKKAASLADKLKETDAASALRARCGR